jgi:hypothetical protein
MKKCKSKNIGYNSIHLLVLFVLEGIHFKELVTKMDDGSIPVMVVQ